MKINLANVLPIGKIVGGQDGAIYGNYLFIVDNRGR